MQSSIRQSLLVFPLVGMLVGCGEDASPFANWTGKTFLIDTPKLASSQWTKPKGFGAEFGAYVPQFLIAVEAGLNLTLTTAVDGVQDMCSTTTEVSVSDAKYPEILITAPSFPMHIAVTEPGHEKVVATTGHNITFKNVLPGTSTDTPTSELLATVDIAELYPLFWQIPNATKDVVCTTFGENGAPCGACPHNGEPYCLTLQAVQLDSTEFSTPIKKVTASDIATTCP
jgi:hypothetical protein